VQRQHCAHAICRIAAMQRVHTDQLELACEVFGTPGRELPVILLHGFPDDASAWNDVGAALARAGRWAYAPYVRGCGPTRFLTPDAPRSGQPAARARDLRQLLDALHIERAVLVGQDWGAATAQALTMLHPERVDRLVVLNGHGLLNMAVFAQGRRPSWETLHAGWYQWMFQTPLAEPLLSSDRAGLARYLWRQWSPGWNFSDATLEAVVRSLANPDWVRVVLSAYRPPDSDADADPQDEPATRQLAGAPGIDRPTLNLQGMDDRVDLFNDTQLGQEAFYRGGFRREQLAGCGHFLHRERPDEVARLLIEFIG
jgi:pimeloyl-ACP methyl ester carboxylesterase